MVGNCNYSRGRLETCFKVGQMLLGMRLRLYRRATSRDILIAVVDICCSCILIWFYAVPSQLGDVDLYC